MPLTSVSDSTNSALKEILINTYLHVFAISLLYYDHLITIVEETQYIWQRPKKNSSYLFFANRYFAFFVNIAVTAPEFLDLSIQLQNVHPFTAVIAHILLTMRVYALYRCSLRVLIFMVSSGAIMIGIASWSLFGQKSAPPDYGSSGCHVGLSTGTADRKFYVPSEVANGNIFNAEDLAGAWEALFTYDVMIFSLTIFKTLKEKRDYTVTGISTPLITLILRDGAIYFAVMALCHLSNIFTFYYARPFLRGSLSTFASTISSTMMSRLMINLHAAADDGIFTTHDTSTDMDIAYRSNIDLEESGVERLGPYRIHRRD